MALEVLQSLSNLLTPQGLVNLSRLGTLGVLEVRLYLWVLQDLDLPLLPLFLQVQVDPVHRVVLGVQGGLALPLVLSHLLVPEVRLHLGVREVQFYLGNQSLLSGQGVRAARPFRQDPVDP